MAKNDLILIDSILEERIKRKIPSGKKDEAFEYLAYEQVLKEYDLSPEEIKAGSVDGKDDGGIDSIYIFVNGHLINDVKNVLLPKSNANLEVFFFTCKHKDTFKQDPVNSIFTSLQEILDFSKKNNDLDGEYNSYVLEKRDIFISTYKRVASILEKFTIKVIFACRGDAKNELGENIESRGNQIKTLCKDYFSGCEAYFEFWGSEEILKAYRKKAEYTLTLDVKECMTHGPQMVVLASLKDYYNFIVFEDKKMRKYLFDSNVRDFMGINAVNSDILNSLAEKKESEDFWWLNNGITIICSTAVAIGKSISISNVQIVNGLQTSECIYRYLNINEYVDDERLVLIKILPCHNPTVGDDIIRSTNNQTDVQSASLRATDKIQADIEDIMKDNGLYYDRRINYYSNMGVSPELIFSPLYLAAGYIALILKRPYNSSSLKQKFMRKKESYNEVFSEKDNIQIWPVIAKIMHKTDECLETVRPAEHGERFLKNVRYLVAFVTISRLLGTFVYSREELISFDITKFTNDEIMKTWNDLLLINGEPNIRSNWRSKNISLGIIENISIIEGIDNFKAIDKRSIRPEDLSDEYLAIVKSYLPKSPWPKRVNAIVARQMNISNSNANIAIGELIKREKRKSPKEEG